MAIRAWIRTFLDYLVDIPLLMYLLAVAGAALAILTDRGYTSAFVESSLPTMSSTAFALFGFMAASLSVLITVKTMPFFESLQVGKARRGQKTVWKNLVGAFLHLMGIFAVLGVFAFSITKERLTGLPDGAYHAVAFIYFALVLLAFWGTVAAIYLLRLVAIAPPLPPKGPDKVTPTQTNVVEQQRAIRPEIVMPTPPRSDP